jgi:cell shape-determining protein MreC
MEKNLQMVQISAAELTQLMAENERLKEDLKLLTEIIKGFGTNH